MLWSVRDVRQPLLAPICRKPAGSITPKTQWLLYAGNPVASLCRKRIGSYVPEDDNRRVELDADRLRAWGEAVLGLGPVRRNLHPFMLLSGMRRTAILEAREEHADLAGRRLAVPNPKGGASRAFQLPLSGPMVHLLGTRLTERVRAGRRGGWLFPADSASGHGSEVSQPELGGLTGHYLRHAYSALTVQADTPLLELKALLNDARSDVTEGYVNLALEHLREHQERMSRYALAQLGLEWTEGQRPPRPAAR